MDRKFYLTFPVAAIMAVTSQAQGKLDLPASLLVGKMELETPAASRAGAASEEVSASMTDIQLPTWRPKAMRCLIPVAGWR